MGFFDKLTASAISIVVSGNTGVTPFLTLLLVGCIERANPTLLDMGETMETLLASWPGLTFLGIMTVLEFVSKCVPIVDEIVDSAMTVIVPVMSILGSCSTFGLFDGVDFENDEETRRRLSLASTSLLLFQIFLIIIGIVFALCMHFFKMLIRLIGEGWLTCVLTVMEVSWVITTVTIAIFIKPIAIAIAAMIIVVCIYNIKRKYLDADEEGNIAPPIQGMPPLPKKGAGVPTTITTDNNIDTTAVAVADYVKMEEGGDNNGEKEDLVIATATEAVTTTTTSNNNNESGFVSPVSTARASAPMTE